MEFVYVPGGCFQMGSPASESERYDNEGPVHEVCVDGFWLGKYEVTNGEYRRFKPGHDSGEYKGYSLNGDRQPVVQVSWEDAKVYAAWLSRQSGHTFGLPTEAEWEYACRAGTQTARYWGDAPEQACRYGNVYDERAKGQFNYSLPVHNCNDGSAVTAPVGQFVANGFGLHDLLGNVVEWVEDAYSDTAYGEHRRQNPLYSRGSSERVLRGSSWLDYPRPVRCAFRGINTPGTRNFGVGFRLRRTD
jgi:formylglycine-generating enzyme required for sulfatase activity